MEIATEELKLEQKERVETLRLRYGRIAASHSFAQLYLWRKNLELRIHLQENLYSTRGALFGPNAWLYPVGGEEEKRSFIGQLLEQPGLELTNLMEEDVTFLSRYFPGKFEIVPTPDDSEYLYDRREQLALEGKRFAGIRNHIRRAERDHALTVQPLSAENIDAAIEIAEDWHRMKHEAGEYGIRDDGVPTELFQLAKQLDVTGVLVLVDGEPYAVCAGYPLSEHMYDFALAKQRSNLPGLSYYAKHALYASLPERFTVINAEDDVGLEGLRLMKHQMRPSGMLEMYQASARN